MELLPAAAAAALSENRALACSGRSCAAALDCGLFEFCSPGVNRQMLSGGFRSSPKFSETLLGQQNDSVQGLCGGCVGVVRTFWRRSPLFGHCWGDFFKAFGCGHVRVPIRTRVGRVGAYTNTCACVFARVVVFVSNVCICMYICIRQHVQECRASESDFIDFFY